MPMRFWEEIQEMLYSKKNEINRTTRHLSGREEPRRPYGQASWRATQFNVSFKGGSVV